MSEPSWVALGAAGEPESDVQHDEVTVAGTRLIATKLLVGDAEPAFRILGDGKLEWGAGGATAPDVKLKRYGANILGVEDRILVERDVDTDMAFDARLTGAGAAKFQISAGGKVTWGDGAAPHDTTLYRGAADVLQTDDALYAARPSSGDISFAAKTAAAANPRWFVNGGGAMAWGDGTNPEDTVLRRSAANVLTLDDKFDPASFNIQVKAGVPVDGDIVGGAADGDMVWDTTGKKMYVRSGGVWTVAGGGGAWQIVFTALSNEPPASGFATLDTRNSHAVLDFDAGTGEYALFRGVLPAGYGGGGVNVKLIWAATSAVTGNVSWYAAFERIAAGAQDIDSDSFGPSLSGVATCDTVSGETTETTIAVSSGANMDSLAAGEMFRLKVLRGAADGADTMAGDAELLAVVITEQ